ncbi:fungal-specific transcription factor domain-containing protein [Mycena belliarum]|uniref:Fungal-specific transcription factor domain-containing protein n=1 Tax=Mycena belliarum TaxID=1033014 RepID=A0AAD6XN72_9AGAR|nr:fungal-specific transcription factor domain-containing protein [Mycena belliae]
MAWPPGAPAYTFGAQGEYEDDDDDDEPSPLPARGGSGKDKDKPVRRRSSKACDQCRKSKCKCEPASPGAPGPKKCRACALLGTPCTFLGPSRKRGPPKGYIDAIEARLHQTEALVGILLSAAGGREGGDQRADGLMKDLRDDPLARAILARIEASPYGPLGRAAASAAPNASTAASNNTASGSSTPPTTPALRGSASSSMAELGSMHPSHEWMDRVTAHVLRHGREETGASTSARQLEHPPARNQFERSPIRGQFEHRGSFDSASSRGSLYPPPHHNTHQSNQHHANMGPPRRPAIITAVGEGPAGALSAGAGQGRRLRRRLDGPASAGAWRTSSRDSAARELRDGTGWRDFREPRGVSDEEEDSSEGGLDVDVEGVVARAVGQLSLNEDRQVRYHGKASGLHLLAGGGTGAGGALREGSAERGYGRTETTAADVRTAASKDKAGGSGSAGEDEEVGKNVGGIWRFPKARVWPVAPIDEASEALDEFGFPPRATQEALLARYFAYVHPGFPVVCRAAFGWREGEWGKGPRAPPLLLLAMYALAARHAPRSPSPSPPSTSPSSATAPVAPDGARTMWPAGDAFLFRAKELLDASYAASRPSTCQALLLMGYREIGIGAMAQAWIYIGMAVRMAQDLGMQRDADGWVKGRRGGASGEAGREKESAANGSGGEGEGGQESAKLFGEHEIAERRRIWYACVIMDKYVSTYIGRPLAIFERDFDTSLPSEADPEEMEVSVMPEGPRISVGLRPGRVISCFNASAKLSSILSQIVQSIYALRPAGSRHAELLVLDGQLEKWLLALPAHLRHDPAGAHAEVPLPQVLTLHMQYWCAVLLLHRPFIRQNAGRSKNSPAPDDGSDVRGRAEKSYELCAGAANHITTIAMLYSETYTLKHCAVFLCYYIFTASIMHVTSLSAYPTDPQARVGLTRCMGALKQMEIVWPSAARALELLRGAQATLAAADVDEVHGHELRTHKRSATQSLDDSDMAYTPAPATASASTDNGFYNLRPFAPLYHGNGSFSAGGGVASRGPAFYAPSAQYERWGAADAVAGMGDAFQGALSTAVMGPAYSTGLGDDRRHGGGEMRYAAHTQQAAPSQYWGEYGAFPYAPLQDPTGLAQNQSHGHQQIYPLHDQYDLYPHP